MSRPFQLRPFNATTLPKWPILRDTILTDADHLTHLEKVTETPSLACLLAMSAARGISEARFGVTEVLVTYVNSSCVISSQICPYPSFRDCGLGDLFSGDRDNERRFVLYADRGS